MIFALVSAISNAGQLVIDKLILSRERVALRVFLPLTFIFLFLFTSLLVPLYGRVDWDVALLPSTMFMFVLMIMIALASNVLYYQGLQHDNVHHHEMLMMTLPLITIMLAGLYYPSEMDGRIFWLSLVAALALFSTKINKEHFKPSRHSVNTMLAVVLIAIETIIIRELLYFYTPVALYAVRTGILAIFLIFYYRPRLIKVSRKHTNLVAVSALIGAIMMLGRFYAFSELGIVYTTLITVLAPVIVFLFSWEILKEHIKFRVVLAAIVVLVCVTLATIIKIQ